MGRQILCEQTTTEYFRELVAEAMTARQLRAADLTEYYLVNLLCQYVRPDPAPSIGSTTQPLAFRLGRALESGGSNSVPACAASAISRCSCPASSPTASAAGRSTSTTTSRWASTPTARSADRNTTRLPRFSRARGASSSASWTCSHWSASAPTRRPRKWDTLRLYEKWLRTGSVRDGQRLIERGVVPNHSIGSPVHPVELSRRRPGAGNLPRHCGGFATRRHPGSRPGRRGLTTLRTVAVERRLNRHHATPAARRPEQGLVNITISRVWSAPAGGARGC